MNLQPLALAANAQERFRWHGFENDPHDSGEVLVHDRLSNQTHLVDGLMQAMFVEMARHADGIRLLDLIDLENESTEFGWATRAVLMQMQTLGMVPADIDLIARFDCTVVSHPNPETP